MTRGQQDKGTTGQVDEGTIGKMVGVQNIRQATIGMIIDNDNNDNEDSNNVNNNDNKMMIIR